MYPSGIGTTFRDPLMTSFRKNQSLNFNSGRQVLTDYKQESGHVHPLISGVEGQSIRQGKGIQYVNGVVSMDGHSRPGTAGTSRTRPSSAHPSSLGGHTFPTTVGSPGGQRRTFEGFSGATWSSRPGSAYPSYGRRYTDQTTRSRPTSGVPNNPPKWLSLDKQTLAFEAFFKETVDESAVETYRVRRCVLKYFLEDDSIKITEPREENSGIPQGSFLKRHRVPKGDGSFYTWRDLDVGLELTFYGRTFRITDTDNRTREFYRVKGFDLAEKEQVPDDPMHARSRPSTATQPKTREKDDFKQIMEANLGKCMDDKEVIAQFLANDRKVLRFYAYWDDRSNGVDSDRRQFRVHYFLADDTVEVLEINSANSGRDPWPALLTRGKLPRVWSSNTRDNKNFYRAKDFHVGDTVSVYGRKLLLHDCDAFTREYYLKNFNREQGSVPVPINKKAEVVRTIPPHNGIGREEDSIMNVMSLHPKPPRQNVMRRLQNKSKMLRFVARLENAVGFDRERVFTVNYHLDTDDISIFEPPVRNSGRLSGKFMDRQKIKKPHTADYYCEQDLHVGGRLHCFGRVFELVDADVYTLNYMAQHPETFPNANPDAVKSKIAQFGAELLDSLESKFRQHDVMNTGRVPSTQFKEVLTRGCPVLNAQEITTIQRDFVVDSGEIAYGDLLHAIATHGEEDATALNASGASGQYANPGGPAAAGVEGVLDSLRRQLQRRGPSGVRGLARALMHVDEAGDRLVGRNTLRNTLTRTGLSISSDSVDVIFSALDQSGENVIDYATLLDALCGELSPGREHAARVAYSCIDRSNAGAIKVDAIFARYDATRHPAVLNKEMTPADAKSEIRDCFEGAGDRTGGMVGLPEFLRVYSEVSVAFADDVAFLDYMSNVWDIPVHKLSQRRAWH